MMDELREKIADAIRDAESDGAMSYSNVAYVALRAIEEAGYVVVPRELPEAPGQRYSAGDYSRRNWEAAMNDLRPLNLEEPRG